MPVTGAVPMEVLCPRENVPTGIAMPTQVLCLWDCHAHSTAAITWL